MSVLFLHCNLLLKKNSGVGTGILAKLEQSQDLALQKLTEDCKRILKLRQKTQEIERKDCFRVKSMRNTLNRDKVFSKTAYICQDINRYFACGCVHLGKNVTFKKEDCFRFGKIVTVRFNIHRQTKDFYMAR